MLRLVPVSVVASGTSVEGLLLEQQVLQQKWSSQSGLPRTVLVRTGMQSFATLLAVT